MQIVRSEEGLNLLDMGVAIFDRDLRLSYSNTAFRTLRRYPEDLCRDRVGLDDLLRFNAERGDFGPGDPDAQVAERLAEIDTSGERELERAMADGQVLLIRYRRIESSGGLLVTFQDCTAERRAEQALRESEERHALVVQATSDGIYDWNVVDDVLYVSENMTRLIDLDLNKATSAMWAERIHRDDYTGYVQALRSHFKGETEALEHDYRVRARDGGYLWVRDRSVGGRDANGRVTRLVGAISDITRQVEQREALEASESRSARIVEAMSDWLFDYDLDADEIEMSPHMQSHFGYRSNVIHSSEWVDRLHPDDRRVLPDAIRRASQTGSDNVECEYRALNGTGGHSWVRHFGVTQRDAKGKARRQIGTMRDITDIKAIEEESERAHTRLMASMSTISDGILLVGPDDRVEMFNDRYVEIFSEAAGGVDLSDLVVEGRDFFEMIRGGYNLGMFKPHPDGVDAWIESRRKGWETDVARWELQLASGAWILLNERRMPDGGRVSVYTDITEFKRREAEIEAQSAILELTMENMGQGITLVDKDLKTIALNQKFLELMEFPPERFQRGFTMADAFRYNAERGEYGPGDIEEQVRDRVELAARFLPHRFERVRPDGTVIEIVGNPIEGGGMVATYTDITERKRAEQALQEALEEFNAVLENIDYGVLFMDADLKARIVNPAFRRLWNIPQEFIDEHPSIRELIEYNRHSNLYDVAPEEWDDWLAERIDRVRAGDIQPVEVRRKDGTVVSYQCVALPDGGRMLTYFDITELKQAEQVARDSEARLRSILENSPIGVAVIRESDNMFLYHNPRFPEVLRGPGQDLVGTVSDRFWTDMEERERARDVFRREGRVVNREVRYRALDDSEIWSLSTYERTRWQGQDARLIWLFDITKEKANREALVEARDAAEAALADLKKAQERLVQSEKMASLGQLTAGIAHEIKNPLNFVNNFAQLSDDLLGELGEILEEPIKALDEDDRDDAEDLMQTIRGNLAKINEHGRRADSIVKNMLLHSREGPSERQTVAVNPIAEEALNLAYHGARAEDPGFNIEIVKSIDADIGTIDCFPQDLMRVFLNLITNGMYAAGTRATAEGEGFSPAISLTTRSAGDMVEIEVRDNGTGIPKDVQESIFLPFFTTKPAGEGTGLGLSLSYDIVVKQHNGSLTVDSVPGDFTAFVVALPLSMPAA